MLLLVSPSSLRILASALKKVRKKQMSKNPKKLFFSSMLIVSSLCFFRSVSAHKFNLTSVSDSLYTESMPRIVSEVLVVGDLEGAPPPFYPYMPRGALRNGDGGGGGSDGNFDTNMVIILAALLCALICALGLNSIVRCALRCSRGQAFETPQDAATRLAATGLKKRALRRIPVAVYGPAAGIPGTECPICLGEFADGEKVRVLPKCRHGFHVRCIDTWLASHSSCPTCRHSLLDHSATKDEAGAGAAAASEAAVVAVMEEGS